MKDVLSRPSLFAGVAVGILFIVLVPLIVATFSAASFTASEMEEEIGRRHVVLGALSLFRPSATDGARELSRIKRRWEGRPMLCVSF